MSTRHVWRTAVSRLALVAALAAASPVLGGPLGCGEILQGFVAINQLEPQRFLAQSDARLRAANFDSTTKGNMLCGPTCVFNLEQLVRHNLGAPPITEPVSYLLRAYDYLKESKHIDLRDGLLPRDLAELFGLAMTRATGRSLSVDLKSIYPVGADVPWIRARRTSLSAADLPVARDPGMTILLIEATSGAPRAAHYVVLLAHDPANNLILYQDPGRPHHTAWSKLGKTTWQSDGATWTAPLVSYKGSDWVVRSVMSVDFAK